MSDQATVAERKYFTTLHEATSLPNLIEIQQRSYDWFFRDGLKELFAEISPVRDFIGRDLELSFLDYYLDEPKFDEVTAKTKNVTYEAALRVQIRLVNKKTGEIKEQGKKKTSPKARLLMWRSGRDSNPRPPA